MRLIVRHLTIALVGFLVIASSLIAVGQSCSGSDFIVQYSSFIPVDHVGTFTKCPDVLNLDNEAVVPLIYRGDGNRRSYRTTESIQISTVTQQATGFFRDAGETRSYDGSNSPVNGSILSNLPFDSFSTGDEDGVAKDCFLWNDSGKDNPLNYAQQTTVSSSGGVVHFSGLGRNPLDVPLGAIGWDMTITINANQLTASVAYNHTCYPIHVVKVNGRPIYTSTVPSNTVEDIVACLTGLLPHESNSTGPQPIQPY